MYRDIVIPHGLSEQEEYELYDEVKPGYSPGYVGAFLDMSRQSVDKAVRKGALIATRVYQISADGKKHHVATYIDEDSMKEYKLARMNRQRVPQGFRATQQRLFG